MLCNWILNTAGVIRIYNPIIWLTFSNRWIVLPAPACLWMCKPCTLLNFLPQSQIVASFKPMSSSFESHRWVMYFPSMLQTPRGHSFLVLVIFALVFLSFLNATPNVPRGSLSFSEESSYFPERLVQFSTYNVWKHVWYSTLIKGDNTVLVAKAVLALPAAFVTGQGIVFRCQHVFESGTGQWYPLSKGRNQLNIQGIYSIQPQ